MPVEFTDKSTPGATRGRRARGLFEIAQLPKEPIMFASLFTPVTDARARSSWIGAAAGAAAFAAGLPALSVTPLVGAGLLLGAIPAILLPALRTGWRGAWAGFVLALIASEVGLSTIVLTGTPVAFTAGDIYFLVGACLILTIVSGVIGEVVVGRRKLVEAVEEEHRQLIDLIGSMPNGCLLLDLAGRVLHSNKAARALLSTDAPEDFGLFLRDLVGLDAWPAVCDRLLDRTPGEPLLVTIPGEHPHRTEWVFSALQQGPDRRTIAFLWDAEEKVARADETRTLLAAIRSLQEGVVVADPDGVIRYVNPAALQIWGATDRRQLIGTSLDSHLDPSDRAARGSAVTERRIRRGDGGETEVELTTSPVRTEQELVGTVAVIRDLTQAKQLARKASTADKEATLGRLVAGAAHEINNPLTSILATAELLKSLPRLPVEAAALAEVILREGERAGRTIRALQTFAGQRHTAHVPIELGEVVRSAVELRETYARAAGIELTIHTPVAPFVQVDPDQIKQVVLNLLLNAEEAVAGAESHRITVTVGMRSGEALLVVNDSGPGVPEALQERIFEPFFTTKPEGRGTGLGLAVSAGIIAEHGGVIEIARGVLGGAQFTVKLPTVMPLEHAVVQAAVAAEVGEATSLNVLVVDDEPAILSAVGRILERLGHSVRTASSGEEALEIAMEEPVDVVLSDLRMPGMSGRELHTRLTQAGVLPHADFIVATGDIGDPEAVEFLETTGLPVLLKPFQIRTLVETLSRTRPASRQVEEVLARAG